MIKTKSHLDTDPIMIFGHNPLGIFHYYFLTIKKWSLKYGLKELNIEYILMQCCIVEKKNEENGSLQHNNTW